MLSHFIENLEKSIVWAQQQDDIDVLNLAKDNMDQLLSFVETLPATDQIETHQQIDRMIPMEWPLWMEACRYEDSPMHTQSAHTYH